LDAPPPVSDAPPRAELDAPSPVSDAPPRAELDAPSPISDAPPREESGSSLPRAVRGGIRGQQLTGALRVVPASAPVADPPAETEDPSAAEPSPLPQLTSFGGAPRHWFRVWGRRGLRLFRPLALPLLHRLEWRVRTAVDKSDFAAAADRRLHGLEARAAAQDALFARTAFDTSQLLAEQNLHASAARQEAISFRQQVLSLLSSQREALSLQQQIVASLQQSTAGVIARLNELRDAVELSRRAAAMRLAGSDYLVRTPLGWLVVPGEDERLLMAMIETGGVLERGTTAVIAALLRPGDTMVDVGAHIGTMTIPAARAVGPRGRVVAVEPGERASGLLRRSLHINSLTEYVTLHECAAGAATGEAMLHLAPVIGENSLILHGGAPSLGREPGLIENQAGARRTESDAGASGIENHAGARRAESDAGASVRVAVRPLDDLVPPGPVRLVKIDAEGYELEVWRGMRRIIADNPELAVIVEFGPSHLAHAGIPIAEWFDALRAPGFTPWEIDEVTGTLRALRPAGELAGVFSMNLLLSREPPENLRMS
jgi:FkbM family methyltransferase